MISDCIRPLAPVHNGPGIAPPRTFEFEDNTVAVYPFSQKLGKTIRVMIIRRDLRTSNGTVFHVCRNAGKWSYRIDYAFKPKTTRMDKKTFIAELTRMGGADYILALCTPLG